MTGRERLGWWLLAAITAALAIAPTDVSEPVVLAILVIALALAPACLRRQRRHGIRIRPWLLLYLGVGSNVVAVVVREIESQRTGMEFPFPGVADAPAMLAFAFIILGLADVARSRRAFGGQGDSLDVVILAVAIAGPFWILALDTYFRDETFSGAHRTLTAAYAVLEVALVAITLRLIVGPGRRSVGFAVLGVAGLSFAVIDAALILHTIGLPGVAIAVPLSGTAGLSFLWLLSRSDLTELVARPPATDPRLTTSRLATLMIAFGTVPTLIALRQLGRDSTDESLVLAFLASLTLLVMLRVLRLLRGRDRLADLDVVLRDAGHELLTASELDEVAALGGRFVRQIAGPKSGVALVSDDGDIYLAWSTPTGLRRNLIETNTGQPASVGAPSPGPNSAQVLEDLLAEGGRWSTHRTTVELGNGARQGIILADPEGALESAQQLALETLGSQMTMALRGIEVRELMYQRRAERRLTALVEQSADLVTVIDDGGLVSFVSPNSTSVLGHEPIDLVGTRPTSIVHPDDVEAVERHILGPSQPDAPAVVVEARLRTAGDEYRWFDVSSRDFRHDSDVGGVVVTARDVTEERAAKLGLKRSEQWFRGLVQHSSDVIAVLDEVGVFTYASPAADDLIGLRPDQLRGRNFMELIPTDDPDSLERVRRAIGAGPPGVRHLELQIERPDRSRRTAEVTITDLRQDPSVSGLVLNIRDVTDRKRLEEDLLHQVLHDDLTGLGSRVQFTSQLTAALGPDRRAGSKVAVLFVDVDDFKNINDSLGHAAGDQVLVEISSRLLGRLRLHDRAARFGGDEFAVILTDVYGEADVTNVADRVLEELSRPVLIDGHEVRLGVSAGIAIDDVGLGIVSPEDLLRAADVAMYEAKAQGKGRWAIFEASMGDQTIERFELSNSLGAAIENDELMVYYQPIVDLRSGRTVGVEALVRWNHPERGMVNPAAFIPLAERNGMIIPLGRSVLRTAVHQVAEWRDEGHDIYASVNISAVQLQREGIVAEVLEIVDGSGLDRRAVVLELTESALIADSKLVVARIDALRDAGLRVAIDDFGTGYATLKYAEEFSADILKIDQGFVARLEDHDESTIVSTVLHIAESMGAQTVAEGIEVPDQHRRLLALGCQLGQGYYFTRPAPAAAISDSLRLEREGEALTGHTR